MALQAALEVRRLGSSVCHGLVGWLGRQSKFRADYVMLKHTGSTRLILSNQPQALASLRWPRLALSSEKSRVRNCFHFGDTTEQYRNLSCYITQ